MIVKIAKNELRTLFYSPVAWFLTIAFLVLCAFFYTDFVYKAALFQDTNIKNMPSFTGFGISITRAVFLGGDSIFPNVIKNLFLFIPLLTMGLISRETNTGTMRLLYSSPVKSREIVLGKYLAMISYSSLLVLVAGVFVVLGMFNIRWVDYGLLLSAILGLYLLVCAYAAIGMFLSALTSYQIVSAIGTFLLIFVLGRLNALWQQYDLVRDLTYFLSIAGRTEKMLQGLITTKDVFYFLLISFLFVSFTMIKLKSDRESVAWYRKAFRYLAVFSMVLVLGYGSSRPGYIGYFDATANKVNTIHDSTQKLLQEMGDDNIEVTLYANLLGSGIQQGLPQARNTYLSSVWEKYLRFKPGIDFRYVMYYDVMDGDSSLFKSMPGKSITEIAQQVVRNYEMDISRFLNPQQIRRQIDLQPEGLRLVMQLKYKGRSAFLRTFDDQIFWPDEQQVGAVLKRLKDGTGPALYYLTGELERDIYKKGERDFHRQTIQKINRFSLINAGFDIDTLSLNDRDIPADIGTLVLADPKVPLSNTVQEKIGHYIHRGGNMLILGEPGKQEILNPVLSSIGVQLLPGTLIELTKDEMPHMVKPYVTMAATELAKEPALLEIKGKLPKGDTDRVLNPGAAGITYSDSGFAIKHLLVTSGRGAWAKTGTLVTDSAAPVFEAQQGDYRKDSFSTVVALTRKSGTKEQRIVVAGDADFMSTLRRGNDFATRSYFHWMNNGSFPLYTPTPKPKDELLTISPETASVQKIICIWVLPGILLILGSILLIRRKRQ